MYLDEGVNVSNGWDVIGNKGLQLVLQIDRLWSVTEHRKIEIKINTSSVTKAVYITILDRVSHPHVFGQHFH